MSAEPMRRGPVGEGDTASQPVHPDGPSPADTDTEAEFLALYGSTARLLIDEPEDVLAAMLADIDQALRSLSAVRAQVRAMQGEP